MNSSLYRWHIEPLQRRLCLECRKDAVAVLRHATHADRGPYCWDCATQLLAELNGPIKPS